MLWIFDADGCVAHWEQFDVAQEAEALARFDALTREATRPMLRRRVRPNAATANAARLNAVVAARAADALPPLHSDRLEVVHHPTGALLDRQGMLAWWRLLFAE